MNLERRQLLRSAGTIALASLVSRAASALDYPNRPVRILVGFPAGGSFDIVARMIGQSLSQRLGQQFIVENRSGATGNIATEAVVNAPPDGHTLLLVNDTHAVNVSVYERLNFNFIRDIAPAASIARVPNVMEVNPAVPARSVSEFITLAKANPGKLNMASGGNGSPSHLSGELFKKMTGVDMVHVPYRGGAPALADLIAGQVHVMFSNLPQTIGFIRSGKLRPLAVTTATRLQLLPDLPTVDEFVPGYETIGWTGIGAPRDTPSAIVERLNREINACLVDPGMNQRLVDLGVTSFETSPADFGKFIADEIDKWGSVVKFAGLKPE